MARIDLSEPFEDYLKKQVNLSLFRSITASAENAIRKQMIEDEKMRIASIHFAIEKGKIDIKNGNTVSYTPNLLKKITEKAKKNSRLGKTFKQDVR